MRNLLLTLCAFFGLALSAQETRVSLLPVYKASGGKAVVPASEDVRQGVNAAATAARRESTASFRPGNFLSGMDRTKLQPKAKMNLTGVKRVDSDKARITLKVLSDWGDGSGFELWLDKDCTIENAHCDDGIDGFTVFNDVDIVLPEGADCTQGFLTADQSATIDIEPGTYDFLVMNPAPVDNTVYMVLEISDSHGDDVTFVAGYEYTFTVEVSDYPSLHDFSSLTANSDIDLMVTSSPLPLSGQLTDEETVSMTVRNIGSMDCENFVASYTINGGTPVVEQADMRVPKGETVTYTFKTKADLSEPGDYILRVKAQGVGEALVLENNWVERNLKCSIEALSQPYSCDFTEDSDFAEWNSINNDNDSYYWKMEKPLPDEAPGTHGRAFSYQCLDDYLVMATPVALEAGENTIEITYSSLFQMGGDKFELLYGANSDVSQMTVLKIYDNLPGAPTNDAVSFNLDEAGNYYFAFHACPTSDDLVCTDIYYVKIYSGSNQGAPDIKVEKVVLPNSSCYYSFPGGTIDVELSNPGMAAIKSFNLTATSGGQDLGAQHFDQVIESNGKATVKFEMPSDFYPETGVITSIVIEATAVVSVNDVEEENTDNNEAVASFVNFELAELPFVSDFTNGEAGRYYWYGPEGWMYDFVSNAYSSVNTAPLVSRGVNLEQGKTYRVKYNRRAGMNFFGITTVTDNYKILCGPNGTDVAEWKEVAHVTGDYTNEGYVDKSVDFELPYTYDGTFQFAFVMDNVNSAYSFNLRNVTVSEVVEKDVAISSVAMPTRVPKTQTGEFEALVPLTNVGSTPVSGTIDITVGGELAGQATFTDVPVGESIKVPAPFTIDGELGSTEVVITAKVDGEPESNLGDNTETFDVLITEDMMSYDKIADDTYYGNQPNNTDVGSIGNGSVAECGLIFHLNADAKLDAISVGWAREIAHPGVVLNVYKWDNSAQAVVDEGIPYYPLYTESALVYTATVDKEYGTLGQIEYPVDDDVVLPAGDYLISARVTIDYPFAVDLREPGQLYMVGSWQRTDGDYDVSDMSGKGFGTLAIRARLTDPVGSSISSVEDGKTELSLYPNPASETLNITSGGEQITNVAIYSASGAIMCASSVNGDSFTCNVSGYTPGVYFARVTTKAGMEVMKFIVK